MRLKLEVNPTAVSPHQTKNASSARPSFDIKYLYRLEMWLTRPFSQLLPIQLQQNNQEECPKANGRLDTEALDCAHVLRPPNLEVTNNKTAGHTRKVQPTGHFSGSSRIGVEVIRVDAHSRDHDAEDV